MTLSLLSIVRNTPETVPVSRLSRIEKTETGQAKTVDIQEIAPDVPCVPVEIDKVESSFEHLAETDTNISAIVRWGMTPRIVDGELILDGVERWAHDPVATSNIGLWLNHLNETGEPRRERIKRALRTGRSQTLCKF